MKRYSAIQGNSNTETESPSGYLVMWDDVKALLLYLSTIDTRDEIIDAMVREVQSSQYHHWYTGEIL